MTAHQYAGFSIHPLQQRCRWCNAKGNNHCSVDAAMRNAIVEFALVNGRTWKSRLLAAWMHGEDVGAELQRVRNVVGPTGLLKLRPDTLEAWRLAQMQTVRAGVA